MFYHLEFSIPKFGMYVSKFGMYISNFGMHISNFGIEKQQASRNKNCALSEKTESAQLYGK